MLQNIIMSLIWVLVNYLDFGELRYMLSSVDTSLQNMIAKDMMYFIKLHLPEAIMFPPETMPNFLDNINDIHNICTHNNKLIGFHCRKDVSFWHDLHSKYNIQPFTQKKDAYSIFLTMQCFLTITEYGWLHNTIRKRINILDNHSKSISINDILNHFGFPDNWHIDTPKITY